MWQEAPLQIIFLFFLKDIFKPDVVARVFNPISREVEAADVCVFQANLVCIGSQ